MTTSPSTHSVRLLPSALSGDGKLQYATSYLVDDVLAVDAGSIGLHDLATQARVRNVLLTHSHTDHLASLPILLENRLATGAPALEVWAGPETLACLREDVFNGRIWPRLEVLAGADGPAMRLHELRSEQPVLIHGLHVLPVAVDHTVPTFSFLVGADGRCVLLGGDTGPTERLWQVAADQPGLAAVFLEAAFPDALAELAQVSRHLTPSMFAAERGKLARKVPFVAVHLKPRHRAAIVAELESLRIPDLEIGEAGKDYSW